MNKLIQKQIELTTFSMNRAYASFTKANSLNYNSLMVLYTMEGKF